MSDGAGKGDDYRPVDLKKYNATLDRIFGEKDIGEVQKCRKTTIKPGEKKAASKAFLNF
jgi:hypothetical protein